MSSSASISAAKKRRANQLQPPMQQQQQQQQPRQPQQPQQPQHQPQMMQRPMTSPSLANLTPAQRQQFLMQQQQQQNSRMQQPHQHQQPQQQQNSRMQQPHQHQQQQQQPQQTRKSSQKQADPKSGLTWPIPPIYLMKQMDNMLFQQNQSIDELKNRLNCIENGSFSGESELPGFSSPELDLEQIKSELTSDTEFISSIVDNIINNSNLSEIIAQIDTVHAETRELRDLLHAQQKTMNEMNIMLLKLISQSLNPAAAPVVQAKVILPTSTQRFESATTIGSASSALTQIRCDDAADEVDDSAADEVDDSAADEVDDSAADDGTNHIQLVVADSSNMQTVD